MGNDFSNGHIDDYIMDIINNIVRDTPEDNHQDHFTENNQEEFTEDNHTDNIKQNNKDILEAFTLVEAQDDKQYVVLGEVNDDYLAVDKQYVILGAFNNDYLAVDKNFTQTFLHPEDIAEVVKTPDQVKDLWRQIFTQESAENNQENSYENPLEDDTQEEQEDNHDDVYPHLGDVLVELANIIAGNSREGAHSETDTKDHTVMKNCQYKTRGKTNSNFTSFEDFIRAFSDRNTPTHQDNNDDDGTDDINIIFRII